MSLYCFELRFHTMDNKYYDTIIFAETVTAAAWFGYNYGSQWGHGTLCEVCEYLPNIIDKNGRSVNGYAISSMLYDLRIDLIDPPTFDDIYIDKHIKPTHKIKHSSLSKEYGTLVSNGE